MVLLSATNHLLLPYQTLLTSKSKDCHCVFSTSYVNGPLLLRHLNGDGMRKHSSRARVPYGFSFTYR